VLISTIIKISLQQLKNIQHCYNHFNKQYFVLTAELHIYWGCSGRCEEIAYTLGTQKEKRLRNFSLNHWFHWWAHQDLNLGPKDYESRYPKKTIGITDVDIA